METSETNTIFLPSDHFLQEVKITSWVNKFSDDDDDDNGEVDDNDGNRREIIAFVSFDQTNN